MAKEVTFTDKESRFMDEYMVDLNRTQAAIRAGYSEKTAGSIGAENLKKPKIRGEIDVRLRERCMSLEEVVKLRTDVANGSLNNYFVPVKRVVTPQIQKHLKQLIKELKEEIDFENEYANEADLRADEYEIHWQEQFRRNRKMVRWQLMIKKNPKATMIVDGEPELVETQELDMNLLVKDKERGRIKSIKPTANGIQVEMYNADAAQTDIMRMHGAFAKDNAQSQPIVNIPPMTDNQVDSIINAIRSPKA